MAVLEQPVNNSNPFASVIGDELAPAGTFQAKIIDIRDEFGIQRQKYQSTEMETVDLTCFLFGFRDAAGQPHKISSKRMRISGNEKSSLFAFLKGLLGKAPQYGWDYCSLKGSDCLLTVEHVQRRDGVGVFAAIAALSPVPVGMGVGQTAVGSGQTADLGNASRSDALQGGGQVAVQAAPVAAVVPSVAGAQQVPAPVAADDDDDICPF